jgi:phosphoesterase RecJ-like protein
MNYKMENIDFSDGIKLLRNSEKILITTHINPDGDAIGSALALYNFAKVLGKDAHIIICESDTPEQYRFLANSDKIEMYIPAQHNEFIYTVDAIFILDLSDLSRVKSMDEPIKNSNAKKVLIDHHIEPEDFADLTFSNPKAAATGELIYYFIKQAKGLISKDIAEAIYTAIYTDTGGFRFSATTAQTHRIVGELIDSGANPDCIYEKIYNNNSPARMKLKGLATSNIEYFCDGKLIRQENMDTVSEIKTQNYTDEKQLHTVEEVFDRIDNKFIDFYGEYG